MPGVNTVLKILPSENIAIVVLCNRSSSFPFRISNDILSALLPKFAQNLKNRKRGSRSRSTMPKELLGEWKGKIITYDKEITIRMNFQEDGDVHIRMTGQLETLLNNKSYRNSTVTGNFQGEIPTADAQRHPHNIRLSVKLYGNKLTGTVTAQASKDNYSAYGISSWIELTKK